MQLLNAPGKLTLPFANSGARNSIPVASQILTTPGAASLTDGFPPLTRTPIVAGGVPPSGLDMNGILYELSALLNWLNSGGGFVYDAVFATDGNVNGYPKGARVLRADGLGYWLNTVDGNEIDPESVTVGQSAAAGWVPDLTNGIAAVTMTNANVTLTPAQYGKPVIVISGVMTANVSLIFPNIAGQWAVVNKCTGNFMVNLKTAAGAYVQLQNGRSASIYCDGTDVGMVDNDKTDLQSAAFNVLTADTVLTPTYIGQTVQVSNNLVPVLLTLPLTSSSKPGKRIEFINTSNYPVTVSPQGADVLSRINAANVSGIVLQTGDTLTLICQSSGLWLAVGGTTEFSVLSTFLASVGTSGWQKLPSGLIIQWGVTSIAVAANTSTADNWTFPITFPNACLYAEATPGNNIGSSRTTESFTTTACNGFAIFTSAVTLVTRRFAIGY